MATGGDRISSTLVGLEGPKSESISVLSTAGCVALAERLSATVVRNGDEGASSSQSIMSESKSQAAIVFTDKMKTLDLIDVVPHRVYRLFGEGAQFD